MTRQMPVSPASAFLFLLLLLPFHPAVAQTGTPARPNVVFIVLDDVGFADLGCYGSEISTPNMDRLAAGGLRYNNFHTTALCSPTRAALLTGRNHHTVGMRAISNIISAEENTRGKVTKKAAMLPELLREVGYNTFALGKWHLAPMHETTPAGPYDNWPLGRGFDRFYGFLDAETDQWAPALTYDNHRIDPPNRTRIVPSNSSATSRWRCPASPSFFIWPSAPSTRPITRRAHSLTATKAGSTKAGIRRAKSGWRA
jgi:arylsulfatase A-like enzyme